MGLCEQVAKRLRKARQVGRTVTLKLRYGDFTTVSRQEASGHPTDDAGEIYEMANRMLTTERETDPRAVRLIGVGVTGLLRRTQMNLDLFGGGPGKLHEAIDRLDGKFGKGTVKRARSMSGEQE
jgi:DNA polymerase-4